MQFPSRSLGAFAAAFGGVSLLCAWLRAYVLGWYDPKWNAHISFGVDLFAALLFFVPVSVLGFAIGAYVVNRHGDPWKRALLGGVVLAALFFGVARLTLHLDSVVIANALVWGTLLLGAAAIGVWTRLSEPEGA
jgi:hypothetical protein